MRHFFGWLRGSLICAAMLILGACASLSPNAGKAWIDPSMAVQLAAMTGPRGPGVEGVFGFRVRATGSDRGRLFLNSEMDYRNPRNLSIVVLPSAQPALQQMLGKDLDAALKGKHIRVAGRARTVRIDFNMPDGQPSGQYYYQTHVQVSDARQLQWW